MTDELDKHPCAFKGITVPSFPNFFYLLGPNTVLAHNTVVYMIECQVNYVTSVITKMINLRIESVEPRVDVTR